MAPWHGIPPGTAGVLACIPHTDASKATSRWGRIETVVIGNNMGSQLRSKGFVVVALVVQREKH